VITDPEQRIAALLKFKADFPDSALLAGADQAILSTLIKKLPGQTDRIRHFASEALRRAPRNSRGALAITIAGQLLNADLLLPEAREYALRSLTSQTMASYVREQLAAYAHRGQTPPWSQEFERRYRELRAGRTITLGRIEWKLGHTAEAQRLLEAAHAILPANIAAQATLGELAAKSGDFTKALDYLIPAQLSGNSTKEGTAALESIYRRQHGDSLAGFDAFLDAEYRKRVPNPVRAMHRPPAATRSEPRRPRRSVHRFRMSAVRRPRPRVRCRDAALLAQRTRGSHVSPAHPAARPDGQSRYRGAQPLVRTARRARIFLSTAGGPSAAGPAKPRRMPTIASFPPSSASSKLQPKP
jgi:tetratricopeptide (TPR) repeat protein